MISWDHSGLCNFVIIESNNSQAIVESSNIVGAGIKS